MTKKLKNRRVVEVVGIVETMGSNLIDQLLGLQKRTFTKRLS
jgi:hypothetical protein